MNAHTHRIQTQTHTQIQTHTAANTHTHINPDTCTIILILIDIYETKAHKDKTNIQSY